VGTGCMRCDRGCLVVKVHRAHMATPDATAPYGAVRWLRMAMTMRANTANQWADMWMNSEQGDLKFDILIVSQLRYGVKYVF